MTRKEAIDILSKEKGIEVISPDAEKALKIAINSLEIDEKYQLEYEQADNTSTEPSKFVKRCEMAMAESAFLDQGITQVF